MRKTFRYIFVEYYEKFVPFPPSELILVKKKCYYCCSSLSSLKKKIEDKNNRRSMNILFESK